MTPILLSMLLSGPVQANYHFSTDDIVSWNRTSNTSSTKLFELDEVKRWPVLTLEQIPQWQKMLDKLKEKNDSANAENIKFLEERLKEAIKEEKKKNQSKK